MREQYLSSPALLGEVGRGVVAGAKSDLQFFISVRAAGYEQLRKKYEKFRGETTGHVVLSGQFAQLCAEAKKAANVLTAEFRSGEHGVARSATDSAADAERLSVTALQLLAEDNQRIVNERLHKSVSVAIVAATQVNFTDGPDSFLKAAPYFDRGDGVLRDAPPGVIRIDELTYRSLPSETQALYSPAKPQDPANARLPDAERIWSRQIAGASVASLGERCILRFDMARFGKIVDDLAADMRSNDGSVSLVTAQIQEIVFEGFARAGLHDDFERYFYKLDGDGGFFIFPDRTSALRVAAGILSAAEIKNEGPRNHKRENGMRCFRIGISVGGVTRDGDELQSPFLKQAVRLETAGPTGEIRVSEEFYQRLDDADKEAFGDVEMLAGKPHEASISGRRMRVTSGALWPERDENKNPWPPIKPRTPKAEPKVQTCFVAMPLKPDPRLADVYERLIKPACARASFRPIRSTDVSGKRDAAISNSLASAPMVIAYLGVPPVWNTNVVLELGYRLAIGRPLIILSEPDANGQTPDYQKLLPFQLIYQNVLTLGADVSNDVDALAAELDEVRSLKPRSEWDSPYPIIEIKFSTANDAGVSDAVITDANDAARKLFGPENVHNSAPTSGLKNAIQQRMDPVQFEAVVNEGHELFTRLVHWSYFAARYQCGQFPKARVPLVFNDEPPDPLTGKPCGFLPVIARFSQEGRLTRVRYLYVNVSAALRRSDTGGYYVCDI